MSSKGFNVQYKFLDKTPIGVSYTLIMTYQEHTEHRADVLLISMHIPQEIVSNIRELFMPFKTEFSSNHMFYFS